MPRKTTNKAAAVVGYCRVSTLKQDVSLEAQEERIRAMAKAKGLELQEVIVDKDAYSGDLNREGMERLLKMVRAREVGTVIIAKLDRLTRSSRDAIQLMELFRRHKVALVSLSESLDTESSTGRFFLKILGDIAELERETIGDRTRAAMDQLRKQGYPTSHAPYGHSRQGSNHGKKYQEKMPLTMDEQEQKIARLILELRRQNVSLRGIAAELNERGIATRKGSSWKHQYVHSVLRRVSSVQA